MATTRTEIQQKIKDTKKAIAPLYETRLKALRAVRDARAALQAPRAAFQAAKQAFADAGEAEQTARQAHADAKAALEAFDNGVRE